jgi:hypothetical protein
LAVFAHLTFLATWSLLSRPGIPPRIDGDWLFAVARTTLATIAGPMTGAVARDCQGCCLKASLDLRAFVGPVLLAAIGLQLVPLRGRIWSVTRLGVWSLGWFAWFGSGIVSLGHALE